MAENLTDSVLNIARTEASSSSIIRVTVEPDADVIQQAELLEESIQLPSLPSELSLEEFSFLPSSPSQLPDMPEPPSSPTYSTDSEWGVQSNLQRESAPKIDTLPSPSVPASEESQIAPGICNAKMCTLFSICFFNLS